MRKFNKTNITKELIKMQDEGDLVSNAMATKVIKDFGLRKIHQKLTGNPDSAYELVN